MKFQKKNRPRRAKFHKKNPFEYGNTLPIPKAFKISHISSIHCRSCILSKGELLNRYAPNNLSYMLNTPMSPFNLKDIRKDSASRSTNGVVTIPKVFSIHDNPDESIITLRRIISALLVETNRHVYFDYIYCHEIDIATQAIMDILLKEYDTFITKAHKLQRRSVEREFAEGITGRNIDDDNLKKMIFSIGSPAVLGIKQHDFPDIIRNSMCSRCMLTEKDRKNLSAMKELDTTDMVDYVVKCLAKMNKRLTPKKRNDLCTVFGEILINAEEHSSLKHRFSVGYFQDVNENGKHYGMLKLVILNYGATIYETFKKNDSCPPEIVSKMKALSESYTHRNLFTKKVFEEETLWTLYALQQGVTSVPGKRRGSGTIQFIRSFFNIKGNNHSDNVSRMIIHSGNTQILFDGTYSITEKVDDNNKFHMMTFNESGNIEELPDKKYVRTTNTYFPGTIITANILLNDDDVKEIS